MAAPRSPWVPDEPDTPNIVPSAPPLPGDDREIATVDMRIARPDIGPDVFTLIREGERIDKGIAGFERVDAKSGDPIRPARRDKRAAEFG